MTIPRAIAELTRASRAARGPTAVVTTKVIARAASPKTTATTLQTKMPRSTGRRVGLPGAGTCGW